MGSGSAEPKGHPGRPLQRDLHMGQDSAMQGPEESTDGGKQHELGLGVCKDRHVDHKEHAEPVHALPGGLVTRRRDHRQRFRMLDAAGLLECHKPQHGVDDHVERVHQLGWAQAGYVHPDADEDRE